MAKKTSTNKSTERRFEQELPCKLAAWEHTERSEKLAATLKQIDLLSDQARTASKKFKDQLTSLEVEKDKLIEAVETHEELRPVDCLEEMDFAHNRVTTTRLDTSKVIDERAMEIDERDRLAQTELPTATGNGLAPEAGT